MVSRYSVFVSILLVVFYKGILRVKYVLSVTECGLPILIIASLLEMVQCVTTNEYPLFRVASHMTYILNDFKNRSELIMML